MKAKNILLLFFLFVLCQTTAFASPWAKKEGYWARTGGKFSHGLKHSLFSWMEWWTESREPGYHKPWQGFSVGVGKSIVHTAGGLVQLVTFPIPVDFPDFGIGLHIPSKECPARHDRDYTPPVKTAAAKKETVKPAPAAAKPALKPLTTPSTAPAEKTEAEKAQEAELAALVASAKTTDELVQPVPSKEPAEEEPAPVVEEAPVHESNEDIISANPTFSGYDDELEEEMDEEDVWEDDELLEGNS